MVWTANPDRFYVFFAADPQTGQGQEFVMLNAPYTPLTPAPFDATPPPGAYEPVSGFGKLWRGEIEALNAGDLRTRLGWATAPESSFESAYQCDPHSRRPRAVAAPGFQRPGAPPVAGVVTPTHFFSTRGTS